MGSLSTICLPGEAARHDADTHRQTEARGEFSASCAVLCCVVWVHVVGACIPLLWVHVCVCWCWWLSPHDMYLMDVYVSDPLLTILLTNAAATAATV